MEKIVNICYQCLNKGQGEYFFKTEKNNIFLCQEHCPNQEQYKFLKVSKREAIKVFDEYLYYFKTIKLRDEELEEIRKKLENKIKEL